MNFFDIMNESIMDTHSVTTKTTTSVDAPTTGLAKSYGVLRLTYIYDGIWDLTREEQFILYAGSQSPESRFWIEPRVEKWLISSARSHGVDVSPSKRPLLLNFYAILTPETKHNLNLFGHVLIPGGAGMEYVRKVY